MNDAESMVIGVAIWLGGALLLYFILKCVFSGIKGRSGKVPTKTCCYLCTTGDGKVERFLCFPTFNFQFTHFYQLFYCLAAFFIIVWGTYYIFGTDAVNSLLTGFMIGGGLALKPLMKTVVSGFTADGVNLMGKDIVIKIGDKEVTAKVVRIGMLHTWVSMEPEGELVMVHNDLLNKQPLVIKNTGAADNIATNFYHKPNLRSATKTYIFT